MSFNDMPTDYAIVPKSYFNALRYYGAQRVATTLVWLLGVVGWFRYRVSGAENLPCRGQTFVLVANHNSNWDPPLVAMLSRRPLAFMAKQELFQQVPSRWLYRALGAFAVNRAKVEKRTIKTALMVVKETTWTLALFPEGSRHLDPDTLGEIKPGAVAIAKMAKVPILPIGISKLGRHYAFVIGELLPPPTDVEADTETLKTTLLALKQQARQLNLQ
jgi:1-acyl-sn-glycerol-3-phosphate acyltransferase